MPFQSPNPADPNRQRRYIFAKASQGVPWAQKFLDDVRSEQQQTVAKPPPKPGQPVPLEKAKRF